MSCNMSEEQFWSWIDRDPAAAEEHAAECLRCQVYNRERHEATRILRAALSAPSISLPRRIDSYVLKRFLGEGGFAEVYLAEQQEPVRRQVAVKVIKRGMDSKMVIARFEAERQALALMDHPGVAKVFDAGTTEPAVGGRPYFVMEHVPGVPITEHCDRDKLSIMQRLELLIQVCEAVQHAHQKGVIHRDIKPQNILVAFQDGRAVPKVIDFGVAKALNQRLTEQTIFTEQGQFIGTPEYTSPEQAEMTAQGLDTRSDVYSLGALLYQLLTGSLPFDRASLRGAPLSEIQRIIREQDPPKPSTRLSTMISSGGDDSTAAARNRQVEPRALTRLLRGDLDWITMKAMEKDRTRRYASALDLAGDIRRHLKHEPVVAGPPEVGYRLRKFVRRNRALVTAAGVVLAVLIAGTAVSTWQAVRAVRERDRASEAEQVASQERNRAVIAEQVAEENTAFLLKDILGSVDPARAKGSGVTVRQVLDEASKQVKTKFADQPQLHAAWREAIGATYRALGLHDDAEPHLRAALEIRGQFLDEDPAAFTATLSKLVGLLADKGEYDEAEALCREGLATLRQHLGDEHEEVANCLSGLATLLNRRGDFAAAELQWKEVLAMRRRVLGNEHVQVATALMELAWALQAQGKDAEAEELQREALTMLRKLLGDDHPDTVGALGDLAYLLEVQGKYAAAEPLYREVLAMHREQLGDEHPQVADSLSDLARFLSSKGDYDPAETGFREALAIRRKVMPEEHPDVADSLRDLGRVLLRKRDYAAAEPFFRDALAMRRTLLGNEHWQVAQSLDDLAGLLKRRRDYAAAEPLLREALEIRRGQFGNEHWQVAESLNNLALVLWHKGDHAEAESRFREALLMSRGLFGNEHLKVAYVLNNLAMFMYDRRHYDVAESLLRDALAMQQKLVGDEHLSVAEALNNLAKVLREKGEYAEAESLLGESLSTYRKLLGNRSPQVTYVMTELALLLMRKGDPKSAEPLLREAVDIRRETLHEGNWVTANAESMLGECLTALGRYEEAEPLLLSSYDIIDAERGHTGKRTQEALQRIIDLYEAWKKPDSASKYRQLLLQSPDAGESLTP